MNGQHDFNKMPLTPIGCAILLHNKLDNRKSWDTHACEGFYLKTSQEHYKCYKVWVKETRSMQIADTVFFKHRYITILEVSKADAIFDATMHLA